MGGAVILYIMGWEYLHDGTRREGSMALCSVSERGLGVYEYI